MVTKRLPSILLIIFIPFWVFTGFKTIELWVWLGESALTAGFILFIAYHHRRKVFSNVSYLLIFLFLVLAKVGVMYGYENVPIDKWTNSLFGFRLGDILNLSRNHYDRFVHFTFGLLLYLPVYEIAASAPDLKSRSWTHLISFLAINGCSAIYEIIEMTGSFLIEDGAYLMYLSHQGDVLDAPKDMAMALLGAMLTIALMLLHQLRKPLPISVLMVILMLTGLISPLTSTLTGNTPTINYIKTSTVNTPDIIFTDSATPAANDIIKRSLERYNNIHLYTEVTMKVVRPAWQSEVTFSLWALSDNYALVVINGPARDRGQAFLKRESDLWHWIPSIDRTIRMSDALLSQSWMGSDFSLNDVLRNSSLADDYHATLNGNDTVDGIPCHHITLLPHNDAPVVWGMVETWIATGTYDQVKAIFYDDHGNMVQRMEAGGFNNHSGRRMPDYIRMTPLMQQGHHTIMRFTRYDLGKKLEEGFFSHQQMRRLH
jgi:uncharacterized membrane protein YjdF